MEESARDLIAQLIRAKFDGHGRSCPINKILKAQGYTTYLNPEGSDGGIDILAGTGAIGFDSPRICIQVKSQETPIGRQGIDQRMGVMDSIKADAVIFVA